MDIHAPMSGMVLDGRYELLGRIGEGGMGVVYKARQTSVDRIVAIKMLSPQLASDPNWVHRFFNEAKACSRLQHPNTIRMFDFGQSRDGHSFMAMEYLDGLPLRRVIAASAPMDPVRVLRILIQCCASLTEAHNMAIIHRDIKSDNVYIIDMAGQPDYVKLLDFSVAKLLENDGTRTQAGVIFGTPQYMSPEQARGEPLGPRSDLYALGILVYEMLSGHVPFTDDNPVNVLALHVRSPVPPLPPTTAPDLVQLVMRALEKDQKLRYPSAAAMMEHAQQLLAKLTSGVFAPPAPPPPSYAADHQTVMAPAPGPAGRGPAVADHQPMRTAAPYQRAAEVEFGAGPGAMRPAAPRSAPATYPAAGGRAAMPPERAGPGAYGAGPGRWSPAAPSQGASAAFWLVCLVTGLAVGVGAYWLVLQLGR